LDAPFPQCGLGGAAAFPSGVPFARRRPARACRERLAPPVFSALRAVAASDELVFSWLRKSRIRSRGSAPREDP
jgi:hypothetical protein